MAVQKNPIFDKIIYRISCNEYLSRQIEMMLYVVPWHAFVFKLQMQAREASKEAAI